MKTLMTLTIAGLFSLSANASSLSEMDYESYVQSGAFPGTNNTASMQLASIDKIQSTIEQSPTAAGSKNSFTSDLLGEDIHAQ